MARILSSKLLQFVPRSSISGHQGGRTFRCVDDNQDFIPVSTHPCNYDHLCASLTSLALFVVRQQQRYGSSSVRPSGFSSQLLLNRAQAQPTSSSWAVEQGALIPPVWLLLECPGNHRGSRSMAVQREKEKKYFSRPFKMQLKVNWI